MATTMDEAKDQAERAARSDLLERVLERISQAGTRVVFGEPVERDGRTVITVARARYGFGGGSGTREGEGGDGAGGGVMADPVGYIELGPAGAEFRQVGDGRPSAAFLLAAGVSAFFLLSGVARVLRALRG